MTREVGTQPVVGHATDVHIAEGVDRIVAECRIALPAGRFDDRDRRATGARSRRRNTQRVRRDEQLFDVAEEVLQACPTALRGQHAEAENTVGGIDAASVAHGVGDFHPAAIGQLQLNGLGQSPGFGTGILDTELVRALRARGHGRKAEKGRHQDEKESQTGTHSTFSRSD